jgi:hypothetical protein
MSALVLDRKIEVGTWGIYGYDKMPKRKDPDHVRIE